MEFEKSLHKKIADSCSVEYYRIFGIESFHNSHVEEVIFVQFYLLGPNQISPESISLTYSIFELGTFG